jgi:hypothetical protein
MKPALPKGFRWLKVGDRKVLGYRYVSKAGFNDESGFAAGHENPNARITADNMKLSGPYIAPVRKGRKGK